MIGIDYLSIGRGQDGPEVHRILLGAGVVILEGLDLSRADPGLYDLLCLPLKILGCDGAPARVVLRRRNGGPRADTPRALGQIMRAAVVVPKEKTVRLIERSAPGRPKASQVLLRILEVGICGTDREISAFKYGTPPEGQTELVLGHEALAEVVEAGPDVAWVRPGDLVVPTVRRPCTNARCAPCRNERQDFCVTGEFSERGIVRADGFLCDGILEDERFLVRAPHAIQDVAVLVEPLSVVAKAITIFETIHTRFAFDLPRMRALVLGAGPVGLLAAMALQADGLDTTVFSLAEEDGPQAELVRSFGANYVSAKRTPVERVSERIGKVDVIFEAVGVPHVAFGALPNLAATGVFIMTGVPPTRDPDTADLSRWMLDLVLKNQVIFGTVNAGHRDYEDALHRLEQFMGLFPEVVRSLIGRIPFDQTPEALTHRLGIKDVITLAA